MSQQQTIESTGPDIEAAIAKGCAELGVTREQVMVEVLEEPGRRLLGLGTRQAKVRLTVIRAPSTPQAATEPMPKPETRAEAKPERKAPEAVSEPKVEVKAEPKTERPEKAEKPERVEKADKPEKGARPGEREARPPRVRSSAPQERALKPRAESPSLRDDFEEDEDDLPAAGRPAISADELAEEAKVGTLVLRQLLKSMGLEATVEAKRAETDGHEPQHWTLEITGRELGVLIGRRGETLAALQYLTRLITSREIGHRANLVVDVEGYKARREAMLRRLAKRMAEQAVQRGRTVSMEPMPPHERRIVHLTLRDDPDVTTESVGEGDHRKVTVIPRRPNPQS